MPTVAAMQRKFLVATKVSDLLVGERHDRLGDDELGDVDGDVEDAFDSTSVPSAGA